MKTTVLFLFVFLSFSLFVSCEKDEEPTPVNDIVGTWNIVSQNINDSIYDLTDCALNSQIIFYENGSFRSLSYTDDSFGDCIQIQDTLFQWQEINPNEYTMLNVSADNNFSIYFDSLIWIVSDSQSNTFVETKYIRD